MNDYSEWEDYTVPADSHRRYGGELSAEDFYEGSHYLSVAATRVLADRKFDRECKRNIELRDKYGACIHKSFHSRED